MTLEIHQNLNGTFLALLRSVRFLISSLFVDAANLALDEGVLNVVSDIPGVLIFERTGVDDFICVVRSGVFLVAEPGWYKFWNEIEFIQCDPIRLLKWFCIVHSSLGHTILLTDSLQNVLDMTSWSWNRIASKSQYE